MFVNYFILKNLLMSNNHNHCNTNTHFQLFEHSTITPTQHYISLSTLPCKIIIYNVNGMLFTKLLFNSPIDFTIDFYTPSYLILFTYKRPFDLFPICIKIKILGH